MKTPMVFPVTMLELYDLISKPRCGNSVDTPRTFNHRQVRPIKDSKKQEFGCWIGSYDWKEMICASSVNDKVSIFQNLLTDQIDNFFPCKIVKISVDDPPWMNSRIKTELRKRNREYSKNGKSDKWRHQKQKCSHEFSNSKYCKGQRNF